ncbi:hypothetical protein BAZMOX_00594_5 [methanotrophic endosymbiont of Bathymodiolus azoricus (Menez Gwen)]|nr:hypothetical protein BAZMOX_00594_5 [methanotrophic endosymbiont of Bathymodiolus azoricus (Menez Gwen)]
MLGSVFSKCAIYAVILQGTGAHFWYDFSWYFNEPCTARNKQ